ncbi:MAG: KOW domain-containing RNA-binding protein [Lachnospiraceae bacterium]
MNIKLAISKSGHDKGSIYVIIKEEANEYYLANGKNKTIEKPKRKKEKHIQIIKKLPKEIIEVFTQEAVPCGHTGMPSGEAQGNFRNEEIKRAIKLYANQEE